MHNALIQMTVLMLLGASWNRFAPNHLSASQTRLVLTTTVFYFFLPAMILLVLWQAQLGKQSLQISGVACCSMLLSVLLTVLIARLLQFRPAQAGAIVLASAFPNVTYLGLPVLEQIFGSMARAVVIQVDLFAVAPLVYSLGIAIARHYGHSDAADQQKSWLSFFNTPPFWAMLLAVLLNQIQLPPPAWLAGLLEKMSAPVAPLMIFSLGLALSWRGVSWRNLRYIALIAVIKLLLQPLWAWQMVNWVGLDSSLQAATVMDIAMPSMVLGIIFCDRYHLDSALYAATVTLTTALSMLTLPLWHQVLI